MKVPSIQPRPLGRRPQGSTRDKLIPLQARVTVGMKIAIKELSEAHHISVSQMVEETFKKYPTVKERADAINKQQQPSGKRHINGIKSEG